MLETRNSVGSLELALEHISELQTPLSVIYIVSFCRIRLALITATGMHAQESQPNRLHQQTCSDTPKKSVQTQQPLNESVAQIQSNRNLKMDERARHHWGLNNFLLRELH